MSRVFSNIVRRIVTGGMVISAFFLLAMMILFVANIIYRFFGGVIPGTYELIELFAGGLITFSLSYAALAKSHVIVKLVVSRFPYRVQTILEGFTLFIGLSFWAAIFWASAGVLQERMLKEETLLLKIPVLPFRSLWCLGVLFFCLVLLIDLFNTPSQGRRNESI